jgi:hypothetical protein
MELKNIAEADQRSGRDRDKKVRILRKLGLTREQLSMEEIISSIESIKSPDMGITKETVEKIFNELDIHQKGEIKSEELIDYIISKSRQEEEGGAKNEYAVFMERINEELVPKSQRIIEKLKKLKGKAWVAGDSESNEDIDWIMSVLAEEDLFEPEYPSDNGNGLDYIAKYSRIEANQRREHDLLAVSSRKTVPSVKSVNVSMESDMHSNHRRSTRMSTFLSPSLLGKIFSHLENVAKLEFNIFDLDELVERKTTFYLSYEIFSREDYFDSLIDEDKFKNFINEIIKGYNRSIPYHNDLHAGDVLQTLYHVIVSGDLENVRKKAYNYFF